MGAATAKQVGFVSRLVVERGVSLDPSRIGSTTEASRYITELLAMPRAAEATTTAYGEAQSWAEGGHRRSVAVAEEGMYRGQDGELFKVQRSKESGNLYAKQLTAIHGQRLTEQDEIVGWEFLYMAGAIWTLTADMRLTLEEAKAFGIRYGVCCVCGARLKDAASVRAGIGPICAGKV